MVPRTGVRRGISIERGKETGHQALSETLDQKYQLLSMPPPPPKFPPEGDASAYACHLKRAAQPKSPLAPMAGGDFNLDPFNYATWDVCVLGWSEEAV